LLKRFRTFFHGAHWSAGGDNVSNQICQLEITAWKNEASGIFCGMQLTDFGSCAQPVLQGEAGRREPHSYAPRSTGIAHHIGDPANP
jgi:hypothetical protein